MTLKEEVINLLKEPDFIKKVMEEEKLENVKELFSEKGIELSLEEIEEIGKEIYSSLVLAYRLSEYQSSKITGGVNEGAVSQNISSADVSVQSPSAQQQIEMLNQQIAEASIQDTPKDILNRNKGKIAVGAVSLFVGTFYSLKMLVRYIENIKNKKNWIKLDEKAKK